MAYPSLPVFTHPWTAGYPQNPPSEWRNASKRQSNHRIGAGRDAGVICEYGRA